MEEEKGRKGRKGGMLSFLSILSPLFGVERAQKDASHSDNCKTRVSNGYR